MRSKMAWSRVAGAQDCERLSTAIPARVIATATTVQARALHAIAQLVKLAVISQVAAAKAIPVRASIKGYRGEMGVVQSRHFPRSSSHETTGMLSRGRMS